MYKQGSIEDCIEQIKEPCKYRIHKNDRALELIISTKDYTLYYVGSKNMLCIENKTKFKFNLDDTLTKMPKWIMELWKKLKEDDE